MNGPEVEVKILDIDKKQVCIHLEELGAKELYDGELVNEIYKKEGFKGYYRIREQKAEPHKIIVTLKSGITKGAVKTADEREREVGSVEQAQKDAKALGFSHVKTTRKHRKEYKLGEAVFAIDTYHEEECEVPPFLEIEAPDALSVFAWAKKLGFAKEQLKSWGHNEVIKHYAKQ